MTKRRSLFIAAASVFAIPRILLAQAKRRTLRMLRADNVVE